MTDLFICPCGRFSFCVSARSSHRQPTADQLPQIGEIGVSDNRNPFEPLMALPHDGTVHWREGNTLSPTRGSLF
jgi:hypothetical protein